MGILVGNSFKLQKVGSTEKKFEQENKRIVNHPIMFYENSGEDTLLQ